MKPTVFTACAFPGVSLAVQRSGSEVDCGRRILSHAHRRSSGVSIVSPVSTSDRNNLQTRNQMRIMTSSIGDWIHMALPIYTSAKCVLQDKGGPHTLQTLDINEPKVHPSNSLPHTLLRHVGVGVEVGRVTHVHMQTACILFAFSRQATLPQHRWERQHYVSCMFTAQL